jgi:hypothetical protein
MKPKRYFWYANIPSGNPGVVLRAISEKNLLVVNLQGLTFSELLLVRAVHYFGQKWVGPYIGRLIHKLRGQFLTTWFAPKGEVCP